MVEGGPVRWIGYYVTTDEDIYMTDGSYVEVCNEMYPGKVSWASGDHSAVTTSTPGRWISKWGSAPLIEHDWNDSPYGTSNLKYYVSTSITGSMAPLCSGIRTFSVANISGATYTWSVNGSLLSIVSGQGTHQVTVQRNGSNSGLGWIEVQISTPCSSGSATSKREFLWTGPVVDYFIDGPTTIYTNDPTLYFAEGTYGSEMGITNWNWFFDTPPTSYWINPAGSGAAVELSIGTPGSYLLAVSVTNPCGTSAAAVLPIEVLSSGWFSFSVYPNPTSDLLTVSVALTGVDGQERVEKDLPTFKTILYDSQGKQLRQGDSKDGFVQFDTRSLAEGTYFLHIHQDGEVEKRQIVIRH